MIPSDRKCPGRRRKAVVAALIVLGLVALGPRAAVAQESDEIVGLVEEVAPVAADIARNVLGQLNNLFLRSATQDPCRAGAELLLFFGLTPVHDVLGPPLRDAPCTPADLAAQLLASPVGPAAGPILATHARGEFEPPVAIDINPDPNIVEVVIVAIPTVWEFRPGIPTAVWTFNGTIPGPTIDAKVGDKVIVHFFNLIDTPGGIHWHGVELPAAMDGSHVSAPPTGLGETFTYEFETNRGSLFWYHPHHESHEQIERGLYGALLVRDPVEENLDLPEDERLVVLSDVFLDEAGQIETFRPSNRITWAIYQTNGRDDQFEGHGTLVVNGRADRVLPVVPGVPLRLRLLNTANSRFMRVNVPPAVPVRDDDRGCAKPDDDPDRAACHDLHMIGTDGGLLGAPERHLPVRQQVSPHVIDFGRLLSDENPKHGVILTPGERADVVFTPTGESGDVLPFEWHDWGRGKHMWASSGSDVVFSHGHPGPSLPRRTLFRLVLAGEGEEPTYAPPSQLRHIDPIVVDADTPRLTLTMGNSPPDQDGNMTFWMQERDGEGLPWFADHDHDHDGGGNGTRLTNTDVHKRKVGETVIWEVTNTSMMDHNFHPHGFMFQPLSLRVVGCNGEDTTEQFAIQEEDTMRVPAPPIPECVTDEEGFLRCEPCPPGTAFTVLTAAMRFDDTGREGQVAAFGGSPTAGQSGGWMTHCHILEHAQRGMMTYFELRE